MTTKLTLSLDKTVIERAKKYARGTGRSLSEIVENYLRNITNDPEKHRISIKLTNLIGAVTLPPDFNEEKELRDYLENKHL